MDQLRAPRFTDAQVLHTESVEYLRGAEAEEAGKRAVRGGKGLELGRLEQSSTAKCSMEGGYMVASS